MKKTGAGCLTRIGIFDDSGDGDVAVVGEAVAVEADSGEGGVAAFGEKGEVADDEICFQTC